MKFIILELKYTLDKGIFSIALGEASLVAQMARAEAVVKARAARDKVLTKTPFCLIHFFTMPYSYVSALDSLTGCNGEKCS